MRRTRQVIIFGSLFILVIFSGFVLADEFLAKIIRDDALFYDDVTEEAETDFASINIQEGLAIDEVYKLAEQNNIELKQASYDLEQAESNFDEAKDLKNLEPTAQMPYIDSMGNLIMVVNPDQKLQMEVSKEIVYYQAKNGVEIAKKGVDLAKQNLQHKVTDLLLNYTKADEALDLAKANHERAEKLLEMTNAQYIQGLIAKSQVLDSEVALSQAENGLKGAEVQYNIAKEDLLAAIGIEDFGGLMIEKITPDNNYLDIDADNIEQVLEYAFAHRIDYLMQKDQTNYEKKRYEIYKEHYTYYGNQKDKIRAQEIVYEKEKLNLLNSKRNIRSQLYKAVLGYNNAVEQLTSLQKNVAKAKESLRIAELRYDAGLGTSLDVITSQVNLTQTENQMLDGKYQIMTMKNNIETAFGGTIEEYQEFLSQTNTEE